MYRQTCFCHFDDIAIGSKSNLERVNNSTFKNNNNKEDEDNDDDDK